MGKPSQTQKSLLASFLIRFPATHFLKQLVGMLGFLQRMKPLWYLRRWEFICFLLLVFLLDFLIQCHYLWIFYILQVNYVGKAANLYETGYQLDGSAYVISKYISNTWLWDRVRVSGGAYGGFCDFDTHSGTILCHYMLMKGYNCYFRILCFWGFLFRSILLLILSRPQLVKDTWCVWWNFWFSPWVGNGWRCSHKSHHWNHWRRGFIPAPRCQRL